MWHVTTADRKLRYNDSRIVEAGQSITVEGKPVLCEYGLHASSRLIDALQYAPGPYVWSVELHGVIIHGDDKSVATERRAVWGYDATKVLKSFSLKIALQALEAHWVPSKFGAIPQVVMDWLNTGDESLRSAAWSAAWSAARSAARSAAWSAAESAAESAARSAAESAAESAAWSAAESAAWSAARSAAESAAWSAAWSAARSAARSAQNTMLETMIVEGYSTLTVAKRGGKSVSVKKQEASRINAAKATAVRVAKRKSSADLKREEQV